MAQMPIEDRRKIWRALMRYWSQNYEPVAANKDTLLTTVTETDAWFDANRADYLAALTYSGDFSGAQIALIFAATALMRKGDTADMLARLLGVGVD